MKATWLLLVSASSPLDQDLVRGAATFIFVTDVEEAKALLRDALKFHPESTALWFDLGRMGGDPAEELVAFERARAAGKSGVSLLVWIGMAAFKAGEYDQAERAAGELIQGAEDAKARFGDKLNWRKLGQDFWQRTEEAGLSQQEAKELSVGISDHEYRKHWGNTILGLLACQRDSHDEAAGHLRLSADIRPDYRLHLMALRSNSSVSFPDAAGGKTGLIIYCDGKRSGTIRASMTGWRPLETSAYRNPRGK